MVRVLLHEASSKNGLSREKHGGVLADDVVVVSSKGLSQMDQSNSVGGGDGCDDTAVCCGWQWFRAGNLVIFNLLAFY